MERRFLIFTLFAIIFIPVKAFSQNVPDSLYYVGEVKGLEFKVELTLIKNKNIASRIILTYGDKKTQTKFQVDQTQKEVKGYLKFVHFTSWKTLYSDFFELKGNFENSPSEIRGIYHVEDSDRKIILTRIR